MNHKYIIKLFDIIFEENIVYMVMEWAKNGNLYNYMAKKKKRISGKESNKFFV